MNSTLSLEIFSGHECRKALTDFFTAENLNLQSEAALMCHMRELVNILRPIGKKLNIHFSAEVKDANHALFLINKQKHKSIPGKGELTEREHEVHELVVQGLTNRQIAKTLFIGIETVRTHRKHILTKTGVNNAASLISLYYKRISGKGEVNNIPIIR